MHANRIGDRGAAALAEALLAPSAPRLRHLELSLNRIGSAGVVELAAAFDRSDCAGRCEQLGLAANSVFAAGFDALARAVAQGRVGGAGTRLSVHSNPGTASAAARKLRKAAARAAVTLL